MGALHAGAAPDTTIAPATVFIHAAAVDAGRLFRREPAAGRIATAAPVASVQIAGHCAGAHSGGRVRDPGGYILYLGYRVGQKTTHVARTISQATTSPNGTLRNPLQDLLANHAPGDDIPTLSASAPRDSMPARSFSGPAVSAHPAEAGHRADQCVGS